MGIHYGMTHIEIKLPTSPSYLPRGSHNGITLLSNVMSPMLSSYVGLVYQMDYVGMRFGICFILCYPTWNLGMKLELSTVTCVLPSDSLDVTNGLPWFPTYSHPLPIQFIQLIPLAKYPIQQCQITLTKSYHLQCGQRECFFFGKENSLVLLNMQWMSQRERERDVCQKEEEENLCTQGKCHVGGIALPYIDQVCEALPTLLNMLNNLACLGQVKTK